MLHSVKCPANMNALSSRNGIQPNWDSKSILLSRININTAIKQYMKHNMTLCCLFAFGKVQNNLPLRSSFPHLAHTDM